MAEERTTQGDLGDTHEELKVDAPIRTLDDKVFFQGTALVDDRAKKSIQRTMEADEAMKAAAEEEEADDGKLLGDTRTSTKTTKSKSRKGK